MFIKKYVIYVIMQWVSYCLVIIYFLLIEREKYWLIVPPIYSFIGCFLCVSWLGIKPTTLVYQTMLQPTELPGQDRYFYLFTFFLRERERGKEEEREEEEHQLARDILINSLSHAPIWGYGQQPWHVPWLGIKPATFWFTGQCSIHWVIPAKAIVLFKWIKVSNDYYS